MEANDKIEYVGNEMLCVSFVLNVCQTCGANPTTTNAEAMNPSIVIFVIDFNYNKNTPNNRDVSKNRCLKISEFGLSARRGRANEEM